MNQVIEPTEAEPLDAIPVGPGPGRTVAVAAAWIAVGVIALLGVWLVWTNVVDSSGSSVVESYTSGKTGALYSSDRDGFKVELPTSPRRRAVTGPSGSTVVVDSRPGSGYSFAVIRIPQPEIALESYTPTLDTAAGSIANQVGGEIVSQTTPVPFGKVALKDVVFRKGDEYYRNRMVLTTNGLYTVQAMVKGPDAAPFKHLWSTFQILGA